MRFRLRMLLIVLAVGPLLLAGAWFVGQVAIAKYRARMDYRVPLIPRDAPAGVRGVHVLPVERKS